jgi:hypothetical protein
MSKNSRSKKYAVEMLWNGKFNARKCKIDKRGDEEEEYVAKFLKCYNVQHLVYENDSDLGPNIILVGTLYNLRQVLHFWDAHGRDQKAVSIALYDWKGDDQTLTEILN